MTARKTNKDYKQGSHKPGELVERRSTSHYKDGIGIILEEIQEGITNVSNYLGEYSYIRVYWQLSQRTEIVEKKLIRKVIEIEKK